MDSHPPGEQIGAITDYLLRWREGDVAALDLLTEAVYRELRRLASKILASESGPRTIEPTALVHELYLRLPGVQRFDWQNRAQFMSTAARMMRNILVDHARKRRAAKRGEGEGAEAVGEMQLAAAGSSPLDVLLANDALDRLAQAHPRAARVMELKFFGGLSSEEIVDVLKNEGAECALRTVERDWTFARAWLQDAIRSS